MRVPGHPRFIELRNVSVFVEANAKIPTLFATGAGLRML
jgi:hypothetical protein